ncbi:MAG: hypothetical protein KGL39_25040 [Patescibacteria group bacterium]|nr:hypothetical protein [Patescibacteria group bacterium]
MPTSFPGALDTTSGYLSDSHSNSSLTVDEHPAHHNNLADAVIAVETTLGINPQGSYTDVKTRLGNAVYASPGAAQVIQPTADVVALAIRAGSLYNSNLQEWRNSSGTTLAYVDKNGYVSAQSFLVNGAALSSSSLSDASSLAKLASPAFTGTPTAPTAAQDTNTTQVATTAFVLAQASTSVPLVDGTATAGTSTHFARADHVHPVPSGLSMGFIVAFAG